MAVANEELLLERNLLHLNRWAGETVVVVTGNSGDASLEISRRLASRCIEYPWDGYLSRARNLAISQATQPWILILDGDEHLCLADAPAWQGWLDGSLSGYTVPIRNYSRQLNLFHDWRPNDGRYPEEESFSQCPGYCSTGVLRLFRNHPEIRYEDTCSVHCSVRPVMKSLGLEVGLVDIPIHHFEYLKGQERYVQSKTASRLDSEQKHLEQHPDDPRSWLNAARALFVLNRETEAIAHLERALELPADPYDSLLLSGMLRKTVGQTQRAIADFSRAAALRPAAADPLVLRAIALGEVGRWQEAEADLQAALVQAPWHPMAYNSLGIVCEARGWLERAESAYHRALEIHPNLVETRYNLATLYESLGRSPEAAEQYRLALRDAPSDSEIAERLHFLESWQA